MLLSLLKEKIDTHGDAKEIRETINRMFNIFVLRYEKDFDNLSLGEQIAIRDAWYKDLLGKLY